MAFSQQCSHCDCRRYNVFCGLSEDALKTIENAKIVNHFKRGQYLFYQDNFPSGLYCIESGSVKLETLRSNGTNHILQVVKKGEVLGHCSLFTGESYEASAIAHEDTIACHIPKSVIFELVNHYPSIGFNLLTCISREVKNFENRLCSMSEKNAYERVAEAILFFKAHYLESWTRKEIAEWAGTTPETVMRTLSALVSEKLIEIRGRKIIILQKDALSARASV